MATRIRPPMHSNPITQRHFRRSVWVEIYLPLVAGSLILAGAVTGIVVAAPGATPSVWADISLILLILPGMVLGLVLATFAGGLAYGVWWLIRKAPPYFNLAQAYIARLARGVRRGTDLAVAPVLGANGVLAGLKALLGRDAR